MWCFKAFWARVWPAWVIQKAFLLATNTYKLSITQFFTVIGTIQLVTQLPLTYVGECVNLLPVIIYILYLITQCDLCHRLAACPPAQHISPIAPQSMLQIIPMPGWCTKSYFKITTGNSIYRFVLLLCCYVCASCVCSQRMTERQRKFSTKKTNHKLQLQSYTHAPRHKSTQMGIQTKAPQTPISTYIHIYTHVSTTHSLDSSFTLFLLSIPRELLLPS